MRRVFSLLTALTVVLSITMPATAGLVLSQTDGATPQLYSNGGGTGFGGTLGNGTISMDAVGGYFGNLVVGFTPGNALNDIVALFLNTKPGGYVDADMDDQADGGRRALSNITPGDNDTYPVGDGFRADYGIVFGNFGTVLFELTAGNTPGHLNFLQFTPTVGSISIPLSTIGTPGRIDFFAAYVADSGYNSNESLPYSVPLNSAGNPGFGTGSPHSYENYNQFITTVPEASTICIWGLILVSGAAAQRRFAKAA